MWKSCLFLPLCLWSQMQSQSMLFQADWIAKKYNLEIAKIPPPLPSPQTEKCLNLASNWFALDLNEIEAPALQTLNDDLLWDLLREVGVQAVYLKGLKQGGSFRTGMGLDPRWGMTWNDLASTLQKKGIALIGDALGKSTGLGADFCLALKNVGDYPGLYHLIEIEKKDWKLLPEIATNIPWLTLQQLHKKGYVPEQFAPYVKESAWNATPQIECADGKMRRWIYLQENGEDPVINWLNPSFAAARIAASDAVDSVYRLGEKILRLDGAIASNAKETLSLWIRQLGGFSLEEKKGGIDEIKTTPADLIGDVWTRPALLHAVIAQDAEALKMIYRLFLKEGIEIGRMVHSLQPFDEFSCDWKWALEPQRKFQYYDEILTGEALRMRLIKEDLLYLGENRPRTWPAICAAAHGIKQREDLTDLHLLLAFFYAMQPGAFSFSASDLVGALQKQPLDLMESNENTLYASLPGQMKNRKSFARQLQQMLAVRRENGLDSAELVAVPRTTQPGLMILIHKLKNSSFQLLAVNFGRVTAEQSLERTDFRLTTAIDLMTGIAEKKPLDSSTLFLKIPPLTGKVILFQSKYYD